MKLSEIKIEILKHKNITISLEDDNFYYYWWKSYRGLKYSYSSDKEQTFSLFNCSINMRLDGEEVGYFIPYIKIWLEKDSNFPLYDRYIDLLEFAILGTSKKRLHLLFDYLIYFSRLKGAKFIRINAKEKFNNFYSFIVEEYNFKKINDAYYLIIDNPIEIDEYEHLRIYDDDFLTFDDIYFLNMIGFIINKDFCEYQVLGDSITIDRKNGNISFPNCIIINQSSTQKTFCKNNYSLIKYIVSNYYLIKENNLILDYKIANVDLSFNCLGKIKLITFDEIKNPDNYLDNLIKIKNNTNFKNIEISITNYTPEKFLWGGRKEEIDIYKEISNLKACLDIENAFIYPPFSSIKNINNFNEKLDSLSSFKLEVNTPSLPIKEFRIDFNNHELIIINKNNSETKHNNVDTTHYLYCLKRAFFTNWKKEYLGSNKKDIEWTISLTFSNETITFCGKNSTPNIWPYFIEDLFKKIDLSKF